MKVLVSAAGSPLGQSVVKALMNSKLDLDIFIIDHSEFAAGFHIFPDLKKFVAPSVASSEYDTFMTNLLVENQINLIFPLLSVEFAYFQDNKGKFERLGIEVVAPRDKVAQLAESKYESMVALKKVGLNCPDTVLVTNSQDIQDFFDGHEKGVLKPVFGASGQDIHFVHSMNTARAIVENKPNGHFVLQDYMPGPEYTIGVHRAIHSDSIHAITIERSLKFGLSYSGKIVKNPAIEEYAISVVKALNLFDANNVQLKLINSTPFMFEINPRLSSTCSVRAHFGFNEPELIIKDRLMRRPIAQPSVLSGNFSRYWEEAYW